MCTQIGSDLNKFRKWQAMVKKTSEIIVRVLSIYWHLLGTCCSGICWDIELCEDRTQIIVHNNDTMRMSHINGIAMPLGVGVFDS